jgi:hypothetical protein
MSIKENWNKCDEKCLSCGGIVKRQRGLTKANLKKLLIPRLDINELVITFILIMVICLGLLYQSETKTCREWLKKFEDNPTATCDLLLNNNTTSVGYNESYRFNETAFNMLINKSSFEGTFDSNLCDGDFKIMKSIVNKFAKVEKQVGGKKQ